VPKQSAGLCYLVKFRECVICIHKQLTVFAKLLDVLLCLA